jgi:hypothetical protein
VTVKTVRNNIDWHFRALYRDAREELEEAGVAILGNPFERLRWPKVVKLTCLGSSDQSITEKRPLRVGSSSW